jgi:hypothetical protein
VLQRESRDENARPETIRLDSERGFVNGFAKSRKDQSAAPPDEVSDSLQLSISRTSLGVLLLWLIKTSSCDIALWHQLVHRSRFRY